MITTNPITANDLKELIISTMVEYLKNNSVTLGGGARVTGNLTVDNEQRLEVEEQRFMEFMLKLQGTLLLTSLLSLLLDQKLQK